MLFTPLFILIALAVKKYRGRQALFQGRRSELTSQHILPHALK